MIENTQGKGSFDWLEEEFGITFDSLDIKTQKLVSKLGQSGVEELVAANQSTKVHRGERISVQVAAERAENYARVFETSDNDPEFTGPGSRKVKNTPRIWVEEEINELLEDVD